MTTLGSGVTHDDGILHCADELLVTEPLSPETVMLNPNMKTPMVSSHLLSSMSSCQSIMTKGFVDPSVA